MAESSQLAFRSNPNKDFLRSVYDKEIIVRWCSAIGRPLEYLGLPGADMLDVAEWQDYLNHFTAIERDENQQHWLFLRANVRDVEHRLYSLYGEFAKILLSGRDRYDRAPCWPYDLVNLDHFGGLIYRSLARPKALKKLIQNQDDYERSFLLIITHDVRDADLSGEKLSFLDDLERQLIRDSGDTPSLGAAICWYKAESTPDVARQVTYTNVLLRDLGEAAHFRVRCRPGITYTGTGGTKMVHFVTDFHHSPKAYRAVSEQSLVQVVNLGCREVRSRQLVKLPMPRI